MRTNHFSKFVVVSTLAFIGFVAVGSICMATSQNKDHKILDQVSAESNAAMRDLRWARVALFDGKTNTSEKYLTEVKKKLQAAEKQAPELIVTVSSEKKIGGKTISTEKKTETSDYVPIDAWLTLSEDFVATPEKQAKINKANKHLKNGDKHKALEVLKTADIDVSVNRTLMPLKETMTHVDKAIAMMKEQKYYEANLELKGAEDGLVTDSVTLVEPVGAGKAPAATAKAKEKSTAPVTKN